MERFRPHGRSDMLSTLPGVSMTASLVQRYITSRRSAPIPVMFEDDDTPASKLPVYTRLVTPEVVKKAEERISRLTARNLRNES